MVDPVNQSGQIQNISSTSKSQKSSNEEKSDAVKVRQSDEVRISEEAIDLIQVEAAAKEAASQLSSDGSATLSSDVDRLNALI